jgi:hypothetical protein
MINSDFKRDIAMVLIIFIFGIGLGIILGYFLARKDVINLKEKVAKINCLDEQIGVECLKDNLHKHKVKFSHIVLAQCILESNNLTSPLFKNNKNCFGMRVAAQRFTFAINNHDYGAYAKYESVEDCVLDYKAFQIQNALFITNDSDYFKLLGSIYAEDPIYISKLKNIIKKNKL